VLLLYARRSVEADGEERVVVERVVNILDYYSIAADRRTAEKVRLGPDNLLAA